MSDSNESVTGAPGAQSHVPGEDDTDASAAGMAQGASALDTVDYHHEPGLGAQNTAGESVADDERPDQDEVGDQHGERRGR